MMTMTFKDIGNVLFNPDMVTALNKGETLQIKGGWGPNAEKWCDWKAEGSYFGPWYYHKAYEWRVKPVTIEVVIDLETEMIVKTIKKVAVEIPAPFKGIIPKDTEYSRVYKVQEGWRVQYNHYNCNPSTAKIHVTDDLVYLDEFTAAKVYDILTGE